MTETSEHDRRQPAPAVAAAARVTLVPGTALLLVRHGESVANAERRFTRDEHEPLTEQGVAQARRTALRLAESCSAVALYSSPYRRAHHTALEIGSRLRLEPRIDQRLYEQGFGELTGRPYGDYFGRHAHVAGAGRWRLAAPGGESLEQVAGRVGPAIAEIACRHPGQAVVVVSHGGVMAALRLWAHGDFESAPVPTENAGGYRLVVGSGGAWFGPPEPLF